MDIISSSSTVATIRSRVAHYSPEIAVVPIALLHPTEEIDPTRVALVQRRLQDDGGQLQPIQVVAQGGLVADGHSRRAALLDLGVKYVLVQIHRGPLDIRTWVLGAKTTTVTGMAFLSAVDRDLFTELVDARGGFVIKDGQHFLFPADRSARIEAQHALVRELSARNGGDELARFKDAGREQDSWWLHVGDEKPEVRALLIYPEIDTTEFLSIIESGAVVPAGATRFQIAKRLLNKPIPLSMLSANHTLAESRALVRRALAERSFTVEVSR